MYYYNYVATLFATPPTVSDMADDVYYIFDSIHYLALSLGMAPYTRKLSAEGNGSRYEYRYDRSILRHLATVAGKIITIL